MSDDPDVALLAGLGGIVMLFSRVEGWLNEYLAHLLQAKSALMHAVTVNVSNATITDWIRVLLRVKHHPGEPPDEIMQLLTTVDELRSERNTLVHGMWTFGEPGTAVVQTIRLDRSPVIRQLLVTIADLEELSGAITEATNALSKLGAREGFPHMPPGHAPIDTRSS